MAPDATWVPTVDLVERGRARKDADEVAAIADAVALADDAYADLLTWIAPGMREFEVAARCEYFQFLRGGGRRGSETAVGSGPRSAMPHCIATDRVLGRDEAVMLDLGCTIRGYMSDLTRTLFLGRVPDEFAAIHRVVGEAQARVVERLRPGVTGREMQAVAADHIAAAGYGDAFPHALGHSIGLVVHERPGFAASSTEVIEAGNVITLEPGIYLRGRFGVRTEDIVLVTETGCRTLTAADHALAVR
jgi:Xaa-Pro aminopeptidase